MASDVDDDGGGGGEYSLVMPFKVCATYGGPFDDESYVCGFEAGALDARLHYARPLTVSLPVHAANVEQFDLIAMKHGYKMTTEPEEHGWVQVALVRE